MLVGYQGRLLAEWMGLVSNDLRDDGAHSSNLHRSSRSVGVESSSLAAALHASAGEGMSHEGRCRLDEWEANSPLN
jgi:hypothetical protein